MLSMGDRLGIGGRACAASVALIAALMHCGCSRNALPPANNAAAFPDKLVADVEELIRLTAQYNALAAQVETFAEYQDRRPELEALEERLSAYVASVTAAEACLAQPQREEFDRCYFKTRARPLIEEKRAHQQRLAALAP